MTRLQAACLAFYLCFNILALVLSLDSLHDLKRRAAFAAVVNLTPVYLGGRTNPIVDRLGISLSTYYIAHHWVSRVAIAEGVLHSIVVLTLQPRPSATATSGYVVSDIQSLISKMINSIDIAVYSFSCRPWIIDTGLPKAARGQILDSSLPGCRSCPCCTAMACSTTAINPSHCISFALGWAVACNYHLQATYHSLPRKESDHSRGHEVQ